MSTYAEQFIDKIIEMLERIKEEEAESLKQAAVLLADAVENGQRVARRYLGEHGPTYLEDSKDRPRYVVKLVPEKITSWEGVEWHARYLNEDTK